MLHLTKVAYGATTIDEVAGWFTAKTGPWRHTTRHRPKRADELVGGSLYWILKHRLIGRCEILGFEEAEGGRTALILDHRLIRVRPIVRRAHQGWRYLEGHEAPPDLASGEGSAELPPALQAELAELGLI